MHSHYSRGPFPRQASATHQATPGGETNRRVTQPAQWRCYRATVRRAGVLLHRDPWRERVGGMQSAFSVTHTRKNVSIVESCHKCLTSVFNITTNTYLLRVDRSAKQGVCGSYLMLTSLIKTECCAVARDEKRVQKKTSST